MRCYYIALFSSVRLIGSESAQILSVVKSRNMRRFARFGTIFAIQKNVKNIRGEVILEVKMQPEVCNFTKSNIPPWVFSMCFKLYKWCQIA